jgi:Family of unknown function (DUF6962)
MFDAEGITAVTDYALAAVSLGFAIAIGRTIGPRNHVSGWLWCAAFIAAALAGAAGGTFHGISAESHEAVRRALWTLIIVLMSASGAFMTAGVHAAYVRREDGTIGWLAAGIAVTLVGAAVQRGRLPKSTPLDHNGAYHLIQIAGLYLFYRGARTVRDRPGVPSELQRDARLELESGRRALQDSNLRPPGS